mgnify:CR=1 FL=1
MKNVVHVLHQDIALCHTIRIILLEIDVLGFQRVGYLCINLFVQGSYVHVFAIAVALFMTPYFQHYGKQRSEII